MSKDKAKYVSVKVVRDANSRVIERSGTYYKRDEAGRFVDIDSSARQKVLQQKKRSEQVTFSKDSIKRAGELAMGRLRK